MFPEIVKWSEEFIGLLSFETHVWSNHLFRSSKSGLLVKVELSVWCTIGLSLKSVFGNKRVHKSIIRLFSESGWSDSGIFLRTSIVSWVSSNECTSWGVSWLSRPWLLYGVKWSPLFLGSLSQIHLFIELNLKSIWNFWLIENVSQENRSLNNINETFV